MTRLRTLQKFFSGNLPAETHETPLELLSKIFTKQCNKKIKPCPFSSAFECIFQLAISPTHEQLIKYFGFGMELILKEWKIFLINIHENETPKTTPRIEKLNSFSY